MNINNKKSSKITLGKYLLFANILFFSQFSLAFNTINNENNKDIILNNFYYNYNNYIENNTTKEDSNNLVAPNINNNNINNLNNNIDNKANKKFIVREVFDDLKEASFDNFFNEKETWIMLAGRSRHFGSDIKYNEKNYGIGFETKYKDKDYLVGYYRNSNRRNSFYAFTDILPKIKITDRLSYRFPVGVISGYSKYPIPAVFPQFTFKFDDFGVDFFVLPLESGTAVAAVQLKINTQFLKKYF